MNLFSPQISQIILSDGSAESKIRAPFTAVKGESLLDYTRLRRETAKWHSFGSLSLAVLRLYCAAHWFDGELSEQVQHLGLQPMNTMKWLTANLTVEMLKGRQR